jgi:hypothetical protein
VGGAKNLNNYFEEFITWYNTNYPGQVLPTIDIFISFINDPDRVRYARFKQWRDVSVINHEDLKASLKMKKRRVGGEEGGGDGLHNEANGFRIFLEAQAQAERAARAVAQANYQAAQAEAAAQQRNLLAAGRAVAAIREIPIEFQAIPAVQRELWRAEQAKARAQAEELAEVEAFTQAKAAAEAAVQVGNVDTASAAVNVIQKLLETYQNNKEIKNELRKAQSVLEAARAVAADIYSRFVPRGMSGASAAAGAGGAGSGGTGMSNEDEGNGGTPGTSGAAAAAAMVHDNEEGGEAPAAAREVTSRLSSVQLALRGLGPMINFPRGKARPAAVAAAAQDQEMVVVQPAAAAAAGAGPPVPAAGAGGVLAPAECPALIVIPSAIEPANTLVGAPGVALEAPPAGAVLTWYTHGYINGAANLPLASIDRKTKYVAAENRQVDADNNYAVWPTAEGFDLEAGRAGATNTATRASVNINAFTASLVALGITYDNAQLLFTPILQSSSKIVNFDITTIPILNDEGNEIIINNENIEVTGRFLRELVSLCDSPHDFASYGSIDLFDTSSGIQEGNVFYTFHKRLMNHIQSGFPLLRNNDDISKRYCFKQTFSKDEPTFIRIAKYYYRYKNRVLRPSKYMPYSIGNPLIIDPAHINIGSFTSAFGNQVVFSVDVQKTLNKITNTLPNFAYSVLNREHIADAAGRPLVRNENDIKYLTEISTTEYNDFKMGIRDYLSEVAAPGAGVANEVYTAGHTIAQSAVTAIPAAAADVLAAINAASRVPLEHVGKDNFLACVAAELPVADRQRIYNLMLNNTGIEAIVSIFSTGVEPREYFAGNNFGEFPGSLKPIYKNYTIRQGAGHGYDKYMPSSVDLTFEDIFINNLKMAFNNIEYNDTRTHTNCKNVVSGHIAEFQRLAMTSYKNGNDAKQLMANGNAAGSTGHIDRPEAILIRDAMFHEDTYYRNINRNIYGTPYNNLIRYQLTKKRSGDQVVVLSCGRWIVYRLLTAVPGTYSYHIIKNTTYWSYDQMAIVFAILNNINCVYDVARTATNPGSLYFFPANNAQLKAFPLLHVPAAAPAVAPVAAVLQLGGAKTAGAASMLSNESMRNGDVPAVDTSRNKQLTAVHKNFPESIKNPSFWFNLFRYIKISNKDNKDNSPRRDELFNSMTNMMTIMMTFDGDINKNIIRSISEETVEGNILRKPDESPVDSTYIVYIKTTDGSAFGIKETMLAEDDIQYELIDFPAAGGEKPLLLISKKYIIDKENNIFNNINKNPYDFLPVIQNFELYSLINTEVLDMFYNLSDIDKIYSPYISAYPELFNFIDRIDNINYKYIIPFLDEVINKVAHGAGGGVYTDAQKQIAKSILDVVRQIYMYGSNRIFNNEYIQYIKHNWKSVSPPSSPTRTRRTSNGYPSPSSTASTVRAYHTYASSLASRSSGSNVESVENGSNTEYHNSEGSSAGSQSSGLSVASGENSSNTESVNSVILNKIPGDIKIQFLAYIDSVIKDVNISYPLHFLNKVLQEPSDADRPLSMIPENATGEEEAEAEAKNVHRGGGVSPSISAGAASHLIQTGEGRKKTRRRKHASKNKSKKARRNHKKVSTRHLTRSTMSTRHRL